MTLSVYYRGEMTLSVYHRGEMTLRVYHRGKLAQSNLTRDETGKSISGRHRLWHLHTIRWRENRTEYLDPQMRTKSMLDPSASDLARKRFLGSWKSKQSKESFPGYWCKIGIRKCTTKNETLRNRSPCAALLVRLQCSLTQLSWLSSLCWFFPVALTQPTASVYSPAPCKSHWMPHAFTVPF